MADFWLQQKYINLMSNQLDQFKRKSEKLYNFRCPECGDSQKNKFKARGYMMQHKGQYFYKCHNCGWSAAFDFFLQKHGPLLYKEYMLEKMKGDTSNVETFAQEESNLAIHGIGPLKKLKKISQLPIHHRANKYIKGRSIPNPFHAILRYCDDFVEWTNSILPDKLPPKKLPDRRIIIPLLDEYGNMFGFQGRSLDPSDTIRYVTIIINPDKPRVFGLDRIDKKKPIYAFEGPFDSMFLDNSIAACGSDLVPVLEQLPWIDRKEVTIIYDNEPRSEIINSKVQKAIDLGYNVFIWPNNVIEKDLNDLVLARNNMANIKLFIEENTYSGLSAKMAFQAYKK